MLFELVVGCITTFIIIMVCWMVGNITRKVICEPPEDPIVPFEHFLTFITGMVVILMGSTLFIIMKGLGHAVLTRIWG